MVEVATRRNGRTREAQARTDRVNHPIEAIALCDEVGAAVSRLGDAITGRSWQAVLDETVRIGALVTAARIEFRRLAGSNRGGRVVTPSPRAIVFGVLSGLVAALVVTTAVIAVRAVLA